MQDLEKKNDPRLPEFPELEPVVFLLIEWILGGTHNRQVTSESDNRMDTHSEYSIQKKMDNKRAAGEVWTVLVPKLDV